MKAKLVLPLLAVLSLPAWGQQVEMKAVKEKIPTYQIGSHLFYRTCLSGSGRLHLSVSVV